MYWYNNNNNNNNNNNKLCQSMVLVVFKTKIVNEIKLTLLFLWPASNFLEHFYSCVSPF